MLAIPGFLIGALVGWLRATRLGGTRADKLQYAVTHGLFFFLLALGISIWADWQGWL